MPTFFLDDSIVSIDVMKRFTIVMRIRNLQEDAKRQEKVAIVSHKRNLFHDISSKIPHAPFKLDHHIFLFTHPPHSNTEFFQVHPPSTFSVLRPTIMLFKLLIPFILAAVIGVRATPDFHFPNVMLREDIPAGITVHEYNATAAALGAAAAPKRFKSRGLLERRSDCKGARPSCKWYVEGTDCIEAYEVSYGKETRTQTYIAKESLFTRLRGALCGLADSFLVI